MGQKEKIAQHAYETVPYYRELLKHNGLDISNIDFEKQWAILPLAHKKDVITNSVSMISEEYLGRYAMEQLVKMHTSGTTGLCLDIYWDKMDYAKSLLPLWLQRWHKGGIRTKDKSCFFCTTIDQNKDYIIHDNSIIFSKQDLSEEKLIFMWNEILKYQPKWILGQPSVLTVLSNVVEKYNLSTCKSLRYIELTGEMTLAGQETRFETIFGCPVKCHYGTMEVSTIGYEANGLYKLFDSSTYVEILDENGKTS